MDTPLPNFDETMIKKCFSLALLAKGKTTPNPLVGAVITKNNIIISTGYHHQAGLEHAELDAINNAKEDLKGATLYVNLEPCCHTNKKTPPCAQRLIKEGFKKVIISNLDPNPEVSGLGVKLLKDAGIEVITSVLKKEGEILNRVFFTNMLKKRPFIHLKWAQTLDGFISDKNFESKWISNDLSRAEVHQYRFEYDGVMIGANTLRHDNPSLTARENKKVIKAPKRILIIGKNDINPKSLVFTDDYKENTVVIFPKNHIKSSFFKNFIHFSYEHLNYDDIFSFLYNQGIKSILVEGGSVILTDLITKKDFDQLTIYTASKLLGAGIKAFNHELDINKMIDFTDSTLNVLKDNTKFNFYNF